MISKEFMKAVARAKTYLAEKAERWDDLYTVVIMVRDYPEMEELDLSDLAWASYKASSLSRNDVEFLFEMIEKRIKEHTR